MNTIWQHDMPRAYCNNLAAARMPPALVLAGKTNPAAPCKHLESMSLMHADASAGLTVASAADDGTELLGDRHSCLQHLAGVSVLQLQRLALILLLSGSSSKQVHLDLVRSCLQLGCVLLVSPVRSSAVLSHFMHVGGPDLDLHGHPTRTLHCRVQGLVPRSLGIDYVVIVLATNLPPQAMDSWLDPALQCQAWSVPPAMIASS